MHTPPKSYAPIPGSPPQATTRKPPIGAESVTPDKSLPSGHVGRVLELNPPSPGPETQPLSQRTCYPWQTLPQFETASVYKERADANMKQFLANNRKPTVGPTIAPDWPGICQWIEEGPRKKLLSTEKGKHLMLFLHEVCQTLRHNGDELKRLTRKVTGLLTACLDRPPTILPIFSIYSAVEMVVDFVLYHDHFPASLTKELNVNRLRLRKWVVEQHSQSTIHANSSMWDNDLERASLEAILDLGPIGMQQWLEMQGALYCCLKTICGRDNFLDHNSQVSNYIWSHLDPSDVSAQAIQVLHPQIELYIGYIHASLVLPLMFKTPLPTLPKQVISGYRRPQTEDPVLPSAEASGRLDFPPLAPLKKTTIGEEFEFYNQEGNTFSTEAEADRILTQWSHNIDETAAQEGIDDYSITQLKDEAVPELNLTVGTWQARFYRDWDHILEVNTSPYRFDQTFRVGKVDYPVYRLFDLFIIDIGEKLGLKACSGHKHLDLRTLDGNSEVACRLLFDVENRAWFSRLLNRERSAYKHFRYLSQQGQAGLVNPLIGYFNAQLALAPQRRTDGTWSTLVALQEALGNILENCSEWVLPPLRFRLSAYDEPPEPGFEVTPATTTIEFRFFHGARSGAEVKAINRMLLAWIELMERNQHNNLPLPPLTNKSNPMAYPNDEEVLDLFEDFVKNQLRLEPKEIEEIMALLPHLKRPGNSSPSTASHD